MSAIRPCASATAQMPKLQAAADWHRLAHEKAKGRERQRLGFCRMMNAATRARPRATVAQLREEEGHRLGYHQEAVSRSLSNPKRRNETRIDDASDRCSFPRELRESERETKLDDAVQRTAVRSQRVHAFLISGSGSTGGACFGLMRASITKEPVQPQCLSLLNSPTPLMLRPGRCA